MAVTYIYALIFLILVQQCLCKSRLDDPEYAEMERDVAHLRSQVYGRNGKESTDPQEWGQLAMFLQAKDVKFHEDSVKMQPEALHCFEKAIELADRSTNVLLLTHRKGILLKMMSRGEEAIAAHEWVIERATAPLDISESLQNKGHALTMLGRVDEAIVVFREAVTISPYNFGLYIAFVEALLEKKAPEAELRELYEQIENNIVFFRANKQAIRREVAASKSALQVNEVDDEGPVYWALFLLGDKLKDYTRAWKYLDIAHDLVKHSRPLIKDLDKDVAQAQQIEQIFRKDFFPDPEKSGIGKFTKTPIFIVGMMRSGSTLTETMLDAHPDIFGMGEDSVFNANLMDLRDGIVHASEADSLHQQTNRDADGPSMPNTAKTVSKFAKLVTRKMLALAKNATTADGGVSNVGTVKHVVDKMLFNYRNIGFIHLVFPKAVIIHTMRDPMDTLYSCTRHLFAEGFEWTLDAEQLAQQYYLYLRIMEHFRKVLPGRVVDVRYEQLIHDPETVMRQVIEKIGDIEWDESILNFHSSKRIVHTPSLSQVRHKLYKGSIGYWRKYAKQLEPVSSALKRYLKNFKRPLPYANEINWDLDPNWGKYAELGMEPAPESSVYAGKPVVGKALRAAKNSVKVADKSKTNSKDTSMSVASKKKSASVSSASMSSGSGSKVKVKSDDSDTESDSTIFDSATKSSKRNKSKSKSKSKAKLSKKPKKSSSRKNKKSKRSKKEKKEKSKNARRIQQQKDEEEEDVEASNQKQRKVREQRSKQENMSVKQVTGSQAAAKNKAKAIEDVVSRPGSVLVIPAAVEKELREQYEALLKQLRYERSRDRLSQLALTFGDKGMHNKVLDELTSLGYAMVNARENEVAVQIFEYLDTKISEISAQSVKKNGKKVQPNIAILIAFGTVLAQTQQFDRSIVMLSRAIALVERKNAGYAMSPDLLDVYSRRGEVYSVLKMQNEALRDYTTFLTKMDQNDFPLRREHAQVLISRGQIYLEQSRVTKALPDFELANEMLDKKDPKVWIWIGKTLKDFADTEGCLAACNKSLALQPDGNKEAWMEKAIALLEVSRWQEAMDLIDIVLKIDPQNKMAWGYLGLMYISMGRHSDALKNFDRALKTDPMDQTVMQMSGVCLLGEGRFNQSAAMFDRDLRANPQHIVWFHREILFALWMSVDAPVISFYPDRRLSPLVLEQLSQMNNWEKLVEAGYVPLHSTKLAAQLRATPDSGDFVMSSEALRVVNLTEYLTGWIQLRSPGFLPNTRQHRMFGVSALQMAQTLRFNCLVPGGMHFPDAHSSHRQYPNDYTYLKASEGANWYDSYESFPGDVTSVLQSSIDGTYYDNYDQMIAGGASALDVLLHASADKNIDVDVSGDAIKLEERELPLHYHKFGWRDLMDINVWWRQLSEPRDLVVWIDRLPLAQKGTQLGLSTHLLSGMFKNHRYYPYHDMGVQVVGKTMHDRGYFEHAGNYDWKMPLSDKQRKAALKARTVQEIYAAAGGIGVSVIAPCNSIKHPGKVLNGTRILAKEGEKEGWDLTISTPCTMTRYAEFEEELDYVMNTIILPNLTEFLTLTAQLERLDVSSEKERSALMAQITEKKENVMKGGLMFFFYWVHFAPLSRGTSATGYAVMVAFFLSVGESMVDAVPVKKQLDFEGMFRASPYDFVDAVFPWMTKRMQTPIPVEYLNNQKGYRLSDIFSTPRKMMSLFVSQPGTIDYNREYTF